MPKYDTPDNWGLTQSRINIEEVLHLPNITTGDTVDDSITKAGAIAYNTTTSTVVCSSDGVNYNKTITLGSGTTNYVAKFLSSGEITNSIIRDDGTRIGINTAPSTYKVNINGDVKITGTGGVSLYVDNAIRTTQTILYIDALNAGGSDIQIRYGTNIDRRLLLNKTRSSINSPLDITTLSISQNINTSGLTSNTFYTLFGTSNTLGSEIRVYNPITASYGNLYILTAGGNFLVGTHIDRSTGKVQITGDISVLGTSGNTYRWDATSGTPSNTGTPAGWVKINVNGADAWLPYYQ